MYVPTEKVVAGNVGGALTRPRRARRSTISPTSSAIHSTAMMQKAMAMSVSHSGSCAVV